MNKDQVKGRVKEVGGKIQKEFGRATDSPEHEVEGAGKEAEGKAQSFVGDAKNKIGKMIDR